MTDASFTGTEKDLDGDPDPEPDPRDEMIASVDAVIEEVQYKIENGRVRSPENEKVRVKQYRALGYLLRTKRKILRDKELEEMWEIIEDLQDSFDDDHDT